MRFRPEASDVVYMAKPCNSRLLVPGFCLRFRDRCRVGEIRRAGDQEPRVWHPSPQQSMRGNERADAFIVKKPPDKAERRRATRFGKGCEAIDVDAGSGDKRNPALG